MKENWFARHKKLTIALAAVVFLLAFFVALIGGNSKNAVNTKSNSSTKQSSNKNYRFPNRAGKDPTDVEVVVNQTATVDQKAKLTVNAIEYRTSMSSLEVAGPNETFAVITVTLKNTSDKTQTYDAKDFRYQTATGQLIDMTYATMQNPLDYGDLPPGSQVEGQVTFLVPTDTGHSYVYWEPKFTSIRAVAQID